MGEEQGLSAEEALERLVVFTAMEDAELATRCEAILKPILAARSEGLQPVSVKGEGGLGSLGASRAPSCGSPAGSETPLTLRQYASLGMACESNGLGWYDDDGSMRFQPPAELIAEQAYRRGWNDREGDLLALAARILSSEATGHD